MMMGTWEEPGISDSTSVTSPIEPFFPIEFAIAPLFEEDWNRRP